MTTWIGTNQAGWDAQSIGFHSVNGCTGIVVSTTNWVAGWHVGGGAGGDWNYSGQTKAGFNVPGFLTYLRSINPNPWPLAGMPAGNVQLLVVYQVLPEWRTVLQEFATGINYAGQARGFDVSPKTGTKDPCDFIISHVIGQCSIKYKRTAKMNHVKQTPLQLQNTVVKTLATQTGRQNPFQVLPLLNLETDFADVKPTFFNGGNMHSVKSSSMSSINV